MASEASHLAQPLPRSFFSSDGEGDLRGELTSVHSPLGSPSTLANWAFDVLPNDLFGRLGALRAKGARLRCVCGATEGDPVASACASQCPRVTSKSEHL